MKKGLIGLDYSRGVDKTLKNSMVVAHRFDFLKKTLFSIIARRPEDKFVESIAVFDDTEKKQTVLHALLFEFGGTEPLEILQQIEEDEVANIAIDLKEAHEKTEAESRFYFSGTLIEKKK